MVILAIDPASSSLGYALFHYEDSLELIEAGSLKASKKDPSERRFQMVTNLIEKIEETPHVVSCEEPKLGGRFQTASQTGMDKLLGQIEYAFKIRTHGGVTLCYYHPMTIKAQVGGSGKATKLEVALGAGQMLLELGDIRGQEMVAELVDDEDYDGTDAVAVGLTWYKKEIQE